MKCAPGVSMKQQHKKLAFVLLCCGQMLSLFSAPNLRGRFGDFEYGLSGRFRPETFYAKNVSLLNNANRHDQIWYMRHVLDLNLDIDYGFETYGKKVAEFLFTLRNKAVWGDPGSNARTTESETRLLSAVARLHSHSIPRHIFWMREVWLELDVSTLLNLNFANKHTFKLGAFPFSLGRGISLGDAYAVGPDLLGFYAEAAVDQYAFGAKLSGDVINNETLKYDLYTALLNVKTASLSDTGRRIRGQEYGHTDLPERGFGIVNFLVAARLKWKPFDTPSLGKMEIEPYALFNHNPEQRVEFLGDASSKLGTVGIATEYYGSNFEAGFDVAVNMGRQSVKGWDRNEIQEQNRNGFVVLANTQVVDQNGDNILFTSARSPEQQIIKCSTESQCLNGENIGSFTKQVTNCELPSDAQIGDTANVNCSLNKCDLINKCSRFRDPYTNKYKGWMIVADAAYRFNEHIKVALGGGYASGDDNPNFETIDGDFKGFIGLQEVYSGKRVQSAFLLGGAGKVRRPLGSPPEQAFTRFSQSLSSFSNIIYGGAAMHWNPGSWKYDACVNPNLIFYGEPRQIPKFDALANQELNECASRFLGVEANIFSYIYLLKHLKLFSVFSVFIPGQHFTDIKGKPLNAAQNAALDRLDRTGVIDEIPNLGDDVAFTFNIGMEFKF